MIECDWYKYSAQRSLSISRRPSWTQHRLVPTPVALAQFPHRSSIRSVATANSTSGFTIDLCRGQRAAA